MTGSKTLLPATISMPSGETYVPVMMRVLDRDESGQLDTLSLIPIDMTLELPTGPLEFVIVYIDSRQVRSKDS